MRRQRYYKSNHTYALTFRVKKGLPFVAWKTVEVLLKSAIARTQRDTKVTICHFLWMSNHAHLIIIIKDAEKAKNFYMEVKKKITDYYKRLLGRAHLELWEKKESVSEIADIDKAIEQIAYLYLNPSKANLESSIEKYPGVSTWREYQTSGDSLSSFHSETIHWVRQPAIMRLRSSKLTTTKDSLYAKKLIEKCSRIHELVIEPNAWMRSFGVQEEEVAGVNKTILAEIRHKEEEYAEKREKPVKGAASLRNEPIMRDWKPKNKDRRIFILASDASVRVELIRIREAIFEKCREIYKQACLGERVTWPPGVFPAAPSPLVNALA